MAGASGGLNRSRRPDVRQRPASPRIPARLWTGTDQPRSTGQASTSRVSARQFPPSQEVPDRHRPDPWVAAKCRHRRAARRSGRAPTWRLGTDLEVGDRHQPTACRLAKSRHRREVVDRHQPDPRITVNYRHRRASRISGRAPTWRLWTGTDQPRPSPSPEVVDRHQPQSSSGQASTSGGSEEVQGGRQPPLLPPESRTGTGRRTGIALQILILGPLEPLRDCLGY